MISRLLPSPRRSVLAVLPRTVLLGSLALACGSAACRSSDGGSTTGNDSGSSATDPAGNGRPGNGGGNGSARGAGGSMQVNHVLGTGQSLSLGAMGTPPLSTKQPFANLMFDTGLDGAGEPKGFAPLVETNTFLGEPVETPSSSFANLASRLAGGDHAILVSLHGVSGASYPMVGHGTQAYQKGLAQVRTAKAIAEAQGKTYVVRAINVVHGESDGWQNWNTEYDKALIEWQDAFDHDIKAITGQADDIPLFETQYSAWTPVETTPTNIIPGLQLEAHKRALGKVVLIGPKYFLPYAKDGLHLTNEGYRWLGEYYAKAYVKQVLQGQRWEPVRPKSVTREGTTISVAFHVPAPPLVLDTALVSNPGNFGFEVVDDAGSVPITRVDVTSADTVTITVGREPASGSARVRYAWTGVPGNVAGPQEGPRGNLRDSDATVSLNGYKLYDWCVHFEEPVR